MDQIQKIRLLFIDPHKEWLRFVKLTLADLYDVYTTESFKFLPKAQEEKQHFDLIFVGLNLAQENVEELSDLARSSQWHFIVLFPGFPDDKVARIFFRSGMRDLLGKPYDPESLKKMVKEEMDHVKKRSKIREGLADGEDYGTRVQRFWEHVQADLST